MTIERLNYCTNAIEDFKKAEINYDEEGKNNNKKIIKLLTNSIKFILPNKAELLENFSSKHFELLKLPFPITAFEYPVVSDEFNPKMPLKSSKRIALCWEKTINEDYFPNVFHSIPLMRQFKDKDGIFVLSVNYIDKLNVWTMPLGGVFVTYENFTPAYELPASKLAENMLLESQKYKTEFRYTCQAFPIVVNKTILSYLTPSLNSDQFLANILADNGDEMNSMLQACAVLNCSNVILGDISTPKLINAKRIKKGKTPFFEYKVLEIKEDQKLYTKSEIKGTHASPKTHLRRGHIRKLHNSDKTIWVRASMINAQKKYGVIDKTYNLTKSKSL